MVSVTIFYLSIGFLLLTPQDTTQSAPDSILTETEQEAVIDQKSLQAYQEILEKTNQQLGLWTNPFAVMIASLGVLFTILTIIAALIVFWMTRDARRLVHESLEGHTKILNEYIKQKNQELDQAINVIDDKMNSLKSSIEKDGAKVRDKHQEQITELEKMLKQVKSVHENLLSDDSIFNYTSHKPLSVPRFSKSVLLNEKINNLIADNAFRYGLIMCPNCEKEYVNRTAWDPLSGDQIKTECPHCGQINKIK